MTKKTTQTTNTKVVGISSLVTWTLYFAAFIGGLSSSFYLPAALRIEHDLHTTTALVKLALTVYLAGVSIGSLTIGPLTVAFGMKRTYLTAFAVYTLTNLVCAFTQEMNSFIVARFFQGSTAVAGATLSLAIIASYLRGVQYKISTYTLVALISLGPAIGTGLGGFVLHLFDIWQLLFILLAIGSFGCTLLLYFYIPEDSPPKTSFLSNVKSDFSKLLPNFLFWGYCLMAGIGFGCFFFFLSLSPYIFEEFYQWHHLEYSLVGIGAALGMSGGSIFERLYLARWKPSNTIRLGLAISFGSSFFILIGSLLFMMNSMLFLVLASAILFGCGLFATTSIARAMDNTKGFSAAAAGLVICVKIGIASIVSAFSTVVTGKPIYVGFSFALILIIGLVLNRLIHHRKKNLVLPHDQV